MDDVNVSKESMYDIILKHAYTNPSHARTSGWVESSAHFIICTTNLETHIVKIHYYMDDMIMMENGVRLNIPYEAITICIVNGAPYLNPNLDHGKIVTDHVTSPFMGIHRKSEDA